MTRPPRDRPPRDRPPSLLLVMAVLGSVSLTGCASAEGPTLEDTTIVTWPGDGGSTAGQIIVSVRNETDRSIDPDVVGRGRQTVARLLDSDGVELDAGDARVQLQAVPYILDPGEAGYLIGDFEVAEPPERVADARIDVNAAQSDERTPVSVEDFELTETADGIGASGRLEWDGAGTAVARAIAIDAEGRPLGYLGTSEVRYESGAFTMCCFPPSVARDKIDDVAVFGFQAREEN